MEFVEPQPVAAPPSMPSTAYPPYPEFEDGGPPPSVANAITKGRDLRIKYKSKTKRIPVLPPPRPARPRPGGPMLFHPKLTGRALQAYRMCMRRNTPCITNRVEWLSTPTKRGLLALWREYADKFPAETIQRIRLMLNVNEPFGPDEAYEFFMRIRKEKRRLANLRCKCKKTLQMNCNDKRYVWARDATVSFAKGIQKRLAKPTDFALNDSMLRLSNIVLEELCCIMKMRVPSRRSRNPKAKFMTEVADKVAVWMDEILTDSDDRMLMMDFDEDDDVIQADAGGDGYDDDFLDMMGGAGSSTTTQQLPTVTDVPTSEQPLGPDGKPLPTTGQALPTDGQPVPTDGQPLPTGEPPKPGQEPATQPPSGQPLPAGQPAAPTEQGNPPPPANPPPPK